MTRGEAIRELEALRDGFNVLGFCRGQIWCLSDECADAINMAIEALEALDNTQNTAQHVGSVEGLISRQDAIKEFCDECSLKDCASDCIEVHVLKSLPSADRPRGEWVEQEDDYHHYWECSECGMGVGLDDIRNFCPNCGADMRGE